jgi:predicted regulator of Ras-like GTPase activity (Roadblock/LC7/MglB family)
MGQLVESMTPANSAAWRLELFAGRAGGATRAAVVSHDGRLLAGKTSHDATASKRVAAIVAGIIDFGGTAAQCVDGGRVKQVVIELPHDMLLVLVPLDQGTHLVVLTGVTDREQLAFDLCLLVEQLNQPA